MDGSLWEDFLLFSGKVKKEYQARPIRYGLALAAIAWIMTPPAERIRDNMWEPFLQQYLPTAEERAEALRALAVISKGNVAVREKQQFYRETSRDTAISGVAANLQRIAPALIVPRSDFRLYSGEVATTETDNERTSVVPVPVTIVSPVLEVSTTRRWKLSTAQGEFGAFNHGLRSMAGKSSEAPKASRRRNRDG